MMETPAKLKLPYSRMNHYDEDGDVVSSIGTITALIDKELLTEFYRKNGQVFPNKTLN